MKENSLSSPEEKARHRTRLKRKQRDKKFKIKSPIAKSLESPEFAQRVVLDKKGRQHDLEKITFRDLVEAIQEE